MKSQSDQSDVLHTKHLGSNIEKSSFKLYPWDIKKEWLIIAWTNVFSS